MADEYDWFSLDFWAEELEKKYPSTNLFSLSDQKLSEMLLSLEAAKGMSALPTKKSYFSALRSAWTVVQYGGDDSKDIPDAYI
ncbi:MAG: hypothetical protein J5787_00660 [Alphaproteobacteria bacterium]|nr:hypothetical protein [Alphaproteobacteria bacterium]